MRPLQPLDVVLVQPVNFDLVRLLLADQPLVGGRQLLRERCSLALHAPPRPPLRVQLTYEPANVAGCVTQLAVERLAQPLLRAPQPSHRHSAGNGPGTGDALPGLRAVPTEVT